MTHFVRHESIWNHGTIQYPSLTSDLTVDVAIVGGGITGVTTAVLLKRAGLRVALLTNERLGSGTTGATTAHLVSIPDLDFRDLKDKFGLDKARLTIESLFSAIHNIQAFSKNLDERVQFERVPAYKYTEAPEDLDFLADEADIAHSLGMHCSLTQQTDLPYRALCALKVENQAMFHPLHYLRQLAAQIPGQGSYLFENSPIENIESGTNGSVYANGRRVQAHSIVIATHSPIGVYLSLHTRVAPYMSYVVAFESDPMEEPALYFDTSEPYFYLRPLSSGQKNIWIVGGCDHKTGQVEDTASMFDSLEDYVRARFRNPRFLNRWSNELFESVDGLPYIGKIPFTKNLYTGTGFAGVGMTFGTLTGMINTDLILNRKNDYADIYSPSRVKPIASAARFAHENANVFKWFVGDRLTPSDYRNLDEIGRGDGKLLTLGGKKYAIHRDDHGFLHVFSPVCTHMGGIVHWNAAERTWDCPLHGGRYRCTGEVFEGPPLQDLNAEMLEHAEPTAPVMVQNQNLGPMPTPP